MYWFGVYKRTLKINAVVSTSSVEALAAWNPSTPPMRPQPLRKTGSFCSPQKAGRGFQCQGDPPENPFQQRVSLKNPKHD